MTRDICKYGDGNIRKDFLLESHGLFHVTFVKQQSYIYIYIYVCVCVCCVLFGQVKPEFGVIPSGQENHSRAEHLIFPGRELNVIITEQYFFKKKPKTG